MSESQMSTSEWIDRVDQLREAGDELADGAWHGYTQDVGGPMRGYYVLVRWREPTASVSHDDPDEAVALARIIERAFPSASDPA